MIYHRLQVSVTPGGPWNRFKTYSTIQRTLEIWGFVFAFIFKAWLNNQKFSYRGRLLVSWVHCPFKIPEWDISIC